MFPLLRRACGSVFGYLTETGDRNLLGFKVHGQPEHSYWWHLAQQPIPAPPEPSYEPRLPATRSEPVPELRITPVEPIQPPANEKPQPPTRSELIERFAQEHQDNLSIIDTLPVPEDEREGMKNEAIDNYLKKVRKLMK